MYAIAKEGETREGGSVAVSRFDPTNGLSSDSTDREPQLVGLRAGMESDSRQEVNLDFLGEDGWAR